MTGLHDKNTLATEHAAGLAQIPVMAAAEQGATRRGRLKMILLLLVCASPVIASYFTYYVIRPEGGKTNYGVLIEPQRPTPAELMVVDEQGKTASLANSFPRKWLMISVDSAADCEVAANMRCVEKLFMMRQIRVAMGKERERVIPVWLVTDQAHIDEKILAAYGDNRAAVRFLRVDAEQLKTWLPTETDTRLQDHVFLVDPLGNLMMRFPRSLEPSRIKRDLEKLLKWNGVGKAPE